MIEQSSGFCSASVSNFFASQLNTIVDHLGERSTFELQTKASNVLTFNRSHSWRTLTQSAPKNPLETIIEISLVVETQTQHALSPTKFPLLHPESPHTLRKHCQRPPTKLRNITNLLTTRIRNVAKRNSHLAIFQTGCMTTLVLHDCREMLLECADIHGALSSRPRWGVKIP